MQELTKSMMRFTWVMPLFGLKQMTGLMSVSERDKTTGEVTHAFDEMADVAEGQLSKPLRDAFKSGERLQEQMVDAMFRMTDFETLNPLEMFKRAGDAVRDTLEGATQGSKKSA